MTPLKISKNIFSKELSNSIAISKFLAQFNHSYETFSRFDELYQEYKENTKEVQKKKEAENLVKSYQKCNYYLTNVFKIYQIVSRQIKNGESNQNLIKDEDDLKEFSMVLGLFTISNNSIKFFEKNNITKECILSACNLQTDFLEFITDEPIDYVKGTLTFVNYFAKDNDKYRSRRNIDDFAKRIFDISLNSSMFLETLTAQIGANYDILKEEVETGKDYELLITIDERISLLQDTAVDSLDLNDIKSVLHFGNSLSIHSKYIHDELPKLMLSDEHQNSINTINHIINNVYKKT